MKKKHKYLKAPGSANRKQKKILIIGLCIAGVLVIALVSMLVFLALNQKPELAVESIPTTEATVPVTTETLPATEETTQPIETEPVMLPDMAELYAQNPDIVGWICIDDTKIDYPVMFTPEDPEKYLRLGFDNSYSVAGVPFIDGHCSMDPESDNIIIYGHNMRNGTEFADLLKYEQKNFWQEHPLIHFKTLYEERTYEVFAAFRDRVYYSYEDVFKFYRFIDVTDEDYFNEAMESFKSKGTYDTGIMPEYGDNFIMLVTCAYHVDDGRYVVVAREITEDSRDASS